MTIYFSTVRGAMPFGYCTLRKLTRLYGVTTYGLRTVRGAMPFGYCTLRKLTRL